MNRALLLSLFTLAAGCGTAVVDGACADGFVARDGSCVPADRGVDPAPTSTASPPPTSTPPPATTTTPPPVCEAPRTTCGAECVDLQYDRNHCGACGNVCPSGQCIDGRCVVHDGDLVIIGHDFADATTPAIEMVANAVFGPKRPTVRVLAWTEFASPSAVHAVRTTLDADAKLLGRGYTFTEVSSTAMPSKISIDAAEVVIVFDQTNASDEQLKTAGELMAPHLAKFADNGGTVVTLDGGRGKGAMPSFLAAAGFEVVAHAPTSGDLALVAATDAIARDVPTLYAAPPGTASFTLPDTSTATRVVEDASHAAVVLHFRVHAP